MHSETQALQALAERWRCHCERHCTPLNAAECLRRMSLDLLSGPGGDQHPEWQLMRPLAVVLAAQRSAEGQSECQAYAEALMQGDHVGALHHCHRLIELEEARLDDKTTHV